MDLDKTFCGQRHQIELCATCTRNYKLLLDIGKVYKPVSMTIFKPKLLPKQQCEGYINAGDKT